MTNLTFQKEGSQFHWMYDLINEFYTQPSSASLALAADEIQTFAVAYLSIFFTCSPRPHLPSLVTLVCLFSRSTSWFYYGEY